MVSVLIALFLTAPTANAGKIPKPSVATSGTMPRVSVNTRDFQFPSGMRVVLQPDHTQPVVGLTMVIEGGSNIDPVGKEGIAHLAEHMVFRARHGDLPPVWDLLTQVGCNKNASTHREWTDYSTACSADMLPLLLRLESARLINGIHGTTEAELDAEREVVRNELRMRSENSFGAILPYAYRHLYPAGDPRGRAIVGSHESLDNISLQDIRDFVRANYTPDRVTLAVVGDFDVERSGGLIVENMDLTLLHPDLTEQHLRRHPKPGVSNPSLENPDDWVLWPNQPDRDEPLSLVEFQPRASNPPPTPPAPPEQGEIPVYDAPVAHPTLVLAWTLPGGHRNNSFTLAYAARGVRSAIKSSLPKDSRERPVGEHTKYECYVQEAVQDSVLICEIVPPAWVNREKLAGKILGFDLLEPGSYNPPPSYALARAAVLNLEQVTDIYTGPSVKLAHLAHATGQTNLVTRSALESNSFELKRANELVLKWVTAERARVIILNPLPADSRKAGSQTPADKKAWRTLAEMVDVVEINASVIAERAVTPEVSGIQEKTLANGLRIVALQHGDTPYSYVSIFARGGAANADPRQAYLGRAFTGLTAIQPSFFGGYTFREVYGTGSEHGLLTLTSHLESAIYALRNTVREIKPREQTVNNYVNLMMGTLDQTVVHRSYWANWLRDQHLETHNKTTWSAYHDRLPTVATLGPKDAAEWRTGIWRPDNATVLIVGSGPADVSLQYAEKFFEGWRPIGETAPPHAKRAPYVSEPVNKVFVLDEPRWTQTEVSLYCAAATGGFEQRAHRDILQSILDDQIQVLRERDGVTYGGSAWVSHWADGYNRVGLHALVQNDAVAQTLTNFHTSLQSVARAEIGPDTVQAAAWMRAVATPLTLDTQTKVSYILVDVMEHEADWTALSDYPDQLANTTPANLQAALGACEDRQVTLIEGPLQSIAAQLEDAGVDYEVFDWQTRGLDVLQTINPPEAARVKRERENFEN